MSSENNSEKSSNTLMSLDQLSDTIEVMTGVVNRLKRHLHQQMSIQQDSTVTRDLKQALLSNERELQELQQLARAQRLSIEASPARHPNDNAPESDTDGIAEQQAPAVERQFIIEISRFDEPDDPAERVLH